MARPDHSNTYLIRLTEEESKIISLIREVQEGEEEFVTQKIVQYMGWQQEEEESIQDNSE